MPNRKQVSSAVVGTVVAAVALSGCRGPDATVDDSQVHGTTGAETAASREDFDGGMRWVYKLLLEKVPPAEMPEVARETLSIVRQRLKQHGVERYRLWLDGDDRLVFEMPGMEAEKGAAIPGMIGRRGRLVFRTEAGEEFEPSDLLRVARITDPSGAPAIQLDLGPDGTKRLLDLTEKNIGKKLAIVVDDEVLSTPTITEPIGSGVQISGSFSSKEVDRLVSLIRGGELPVELELLEVGMVKED